MKEERLLYTYNNATPQLGWQFDQAIRDKDIPRRIITGATEIGPINLIMILIIPVTPMRTSINDATKRPPLTCSEMEV